MVVRHANFLNATPDYCMQARNREPTINVRPMVFIGLRLMRTFVLMGS